PFPFDLPFVAGERQQELRPTWAGIAGQLHVLEISGRHKFRAGWPVRLDWGGVANPATGSLEPGSGQGTFHVRCDPCLHCKRDSVASTRPRRLSSAAGENSNPRMAVPEHHDVDDGPSVFGVLRGSTNRSGHHRGGSSGSRGATAFF